jgi:hypothetical protein
MFSIESICAFLTLFGQTKLANFIPSIHFHSFILGICIFFSISSTLNPSSSTGWGDCAIIAVAKKKKPRKGEEKGNLIQCQQSKVNAVASNKMEKMEKMESSIEMKGKGFCGLITRNERKNL